MNNTVKGITKYLWFLREKFYFLNFPILCKLPYGSLILAYGDEMGLKFFIRKPFEENEWHFIDRFLKTGMTFVDIGANQGFYTLLAAKKVSTLGRVFAFEPQPSELKKLKKNIFINLLKNIIVEPLALGRAEGSTNMHVCLDGQASFSSLQAPSESVKARTKIIKVPITTLDKYIQKNGISSIDFVKIDVEGGELDVLKGGTNMLKTLRPILMCECNNIRTLQWGYPVTQLYQFLEDHNYSWFQVMANGFLKKLVLQGEDYSDMGNLIALPNDKINSVANFLEEHGE